MSKTVSNLVGGLTGGLLGGPQKPKLPKFRTQEARRDERVDPNQADRIRTAAQRKSIQAQKTGRSKLRIELADPTGTTRSGVAINRG